MKVAHTPGELERRPRAVAIGTFDGVHWATGRSSQAAIEGGPAPTVVTFHPHPREVLGNRVAARDAGAPAGAAGRARRGGDARRRVHARAGRARSPRSSLASYLAAIGAEVVVAGEDFRFGRGRARRLALLERLGIATRSCRTSTGVSSTAIRRLVAAGDVRGAAALLGRPAEVEGIVVSGDARGGTLAFRPRTFASIRGCSCRAFGIYARRRPGHRAAVSIGVNPHYGGAERRIEAYLLDFDGDLYGERLVVELWERCATSRRSRARQELVGADRARRRGNARRCRTGR